MTPEEVLREIVDRVRSEWPDDKEMQKYYIAEEKEGYDKLQKIDFGSLVGLKEELIESARQSFEAWDEIYDWVNAEVTAYRELAKFTADGLPQGIIDEWKRQAKKEFEDCYVDQLDFMEGKLQKLASINETRQKIDPIKALLIELENIVGNECYNGNIQNYGSWGELESEGRQFRYPIRFYTDSGESKKWTVSPDIPSEELITGHYAFGANELNINRALLKIILHLRNKYGLQV